LDLQRSLMGKSKRRPGEKIVSLICGRLHRRDGLPGDPRVCAGPHWPALLARGGHPRQHHGRQQVLQVVAENGVSVREVTIDRTASTPIYYVKILIQGASPALVFALNEHGGSRRGLLGFSRDFHPHRRIHEVLATLGFECSLGYQPLHHSIAFKSDFPPPCRPRPLPPSLPPSHPSLPPSLPLIHPVACQPLHRSRRASQDRSCVPFRFRFSHSLTPRSLVGLRRALQREAGVRRVGSVPWRTLRPQPSRLHINAFRSARRARHALRV